jgi:hypothetical protein
MGCCRKNENQECRFPTEQIIRGLKAKLVYESCDLICTPADKCACDNVLEDITLANAWIQSLPGEESACDG